MKYLFLACWFWMNNVYAELTYEDVSLRKKSKN